MHVVLDKPIDKLHIFALLNPDMNFHVCLPGICGTSDLASKDSLCSNCLIALARDYHTLSLTETF